MDWLESLTLGLVQGLTEFLPISSDGHLAIAQQVFASLRGRSHEAAEDLFFDIMLHLGTLIAILLHYRTAIRDEARRAFEAAREPGVGLLRTPAFRAGLLAAVATLPLVPVALVFKPWIERAFQSPTATACGFLVTAATLLVSPALKGGPITLTTTSWWRALLVGIAQGFAPMPGVSRSGLTICAALALGFARPWAVGFSLLIAVPAILGAVAFELRKVDPAALSGDRLAPLLAAMALSGVVGYLAISWLVRVVRANRLWAFSVYLVLLAALVLWLANSRPATPL